MWFQGADIRSIHLQHLATLSVGQQALVMPVYCLQLERGMGLDETMKLCLEPAASVASALL